MHLLERERVKEDRKALQELVTHTIDYFKVVILSRDNKVTTEDVALNKHAFGPEIGGLKGMTARPRLLPNQRQATCIT